MPTTISGTTGISQVQDGIITDADISASANITGSKIAANTISSTQLSANSVTTLTIADSAVTAAKMAGGQTGSAPVYGVRAWVRFDGTKDTTGTTSTASTNRLIIGSGNVNRVTKVTDGVFDIVFQTPMPNLFYMVVGAVEVRRADATLDFGYDDRDTFTTALSCRVYSGADYRPGSSFGIGADSLMSVAILC